MITGLDRSTKSTLSRTLLIGALIYFGTFFPYLHFHHDHDDGWSIAISLHPLEIESERLPDHHNDDHHPELRHSTGVLPTGRHAGSNFTATQPLLAEVAPICSQIQDLPAPPRENIEWLPGRSQWQYERSPHRGPPTLI